MQPAPMLNDDEVNGLFGCDKREDVSCPIKFFCAPCTMLNHEGFSLLTIVSWLTCGIWGYVLCFNCYKLPIMGADYNRKGNSVGQPIMVK